MYGAQTGHHSELSTYWFENDVEMYGAQTKKRHFCMGKLFENDVEMYGAQTRWISHLLGNSLRMM